MGKLETQVVELGFLRWSRWEVMAAATPTGVVEGCCGVREAGLSFMGRGRGS